MYRYYNYNDVLDYGNELTIYQILGNDVNISDYPELADYTYKKAIVESIDSAACLSIEIDNNKIVFIGNRNLIEINNVLYVYSE